MWVEVGKCTSSTSLTHPLKMAPLFGCPSAPSQLSRMFIVFLALYSALSALLTNACISAVLSYDRHTLFRIKERMEDLSITSGRYAEYFTPKLACQTSSLEYLLLAKPRSRRRKRGCRAGAKIRRKKQRTQGLWKSGTGTAFDTRCLRSVSAHETELDLSRAPPVMQPVYSDRVFPIRFARNPAPRERVLRPINICQMEKGLGTFPSSSQTSTSQPAIISGARTS